MNSFPQGLALLATGFATVGTASAAEVLVTSDITTSTTWTANNTYNLQQQIFVRNGATLTIEPGVIIASDTDIGGSLAVARGSQIQALGTAADPIIFTSKADVATWTGGNPQTGVWREAANEWGNLTLMGRGYISENAVGGNVPTPNANNEGIMEGLASGPNRYGGGNDDDDSGTLSYVSLRYGGKVLGLNNELNGLSLGGIGRGTDIKCIEIMNNVDDGIEIWGGCVGIKYFSIWNIGDDSFDVDQGWRGYAQFGLIVQGYSLDANQGSGVGDNIFETDGGEDSDWQPTTTATIYNCTVIGQPVGGDHATAWRDNARVQYRNMVIQDIGDDLVAFDDVDGDGANGYGHNGTLSWAATWTTDWDQTPPHANDPPGNYYDFYKAHFSGKLAEITDSVFFRIGDTSEATNRGVLPGNGSNNNVLIAGSNDADAPVTSVTRGPQVTKGGQIMFPVVGLDPRPANEALVSADGAPNGHEFFQRKLYRGGFEPTGPTWLCGWTASDAFGFTSNSCNGPIGENYCSANNNSTGSPADISMSGHQSASAGTLTASATPVPNQPGIFFHARNQIQTTFGNGFLCAGGGLVRGLITFGSGNTASYTYDNSHPRRDLGAYACSTRNFQYWYRDPMGGGAQFNTSDGISVQILP